MDDLVGALLDKLDGTSARLLKASSPIGGELDSFADFCVFGIAPTALVFFKLRASGLYGPTATVLLVVASAIYVVAAAVRLARFNITEPPGGENYFYGVPTTMCGILVASAYLTWDGNRLGDTVLFYSPILLAVLGLLKVSTFKLPKLKRGATSP